MNTQQKVVSPIQTTELEGQGLAFHRTEADIAAEAASIISDEQGKFNKFMAGRETEGPEIWDDQAFRSREWDVRKRELRDQDSLELNRVAGIRRKAGRVATAIDIGWVDPLVQPKHWTRDPSKRQQTNERLRDARLSSV